MNKTILKKIAKDWCKSILLSNEAMVSFDKLLEDGLLTMEEVMYIQEYTDKIANSITKNNSGDTIIEIFSQYYDILD